MKFNTSDFLALFEQKNKTDFDRSKLILVSEIYAQHIKQLGVTQLVENAKHFVIIYYVGPLDHHHVQIEYYSVKLSDADLIPLRSMNYMEDIPRDITFLHSLEQTLKNYIGMDDLTIQHMYAITQNKYEKIYEKSQYKDATYYDVYATIGEKQLITVHVGVELRVNQVDNTITILNITNSNYWTSALYCECQP